jgi:hypothetical protein
MQGPSKGSEAYRAALEDERKARRLRNAQLPPGEPEESLALQQEEAELYGTTEPTVSRWVNGVSSPGAGFRLQIQERHGVLWAWWDEAVPLPDAASQSGSAA